jgi:hypothetical protein
MGRVFWMKLLGNTDDDSYDLATHRTIFIRFLKANLSEPDQYTHWASQSQTIQTMSQHVYPDVIIREDEVDIYLPAMVMQTQVSG